MFYRFEVSQSETLIEFRVIGDCVPSRSVSYSIRFSFISSLYSCVM